jgi:RNA polymerase sigma factor (sigma-70 family)
MPLNTNQLKQILEKMDLEEGYKFLTEREKSIISLYYLEGYKDEEIAFYYGVTRQNIFKIRKNGLTKLKNILKYFLI